MQLANLISNGLRVERSNYTEIFELINVNIGAT